MPLHFLSHKFHMAHLFPTFYPLAIWMDHQFGLFPLVPRVCAPLSNMCPQQFPLPCHWPITPPLELDRIIHNPWEHFAFPCQWPLSPCVRQPPSPIWPLSIACKGSREGVKLLLMVGRTVVWDKPQPEKAHPGNPATQFPPRLHRIISQSPPLWDEQQAIL